MNTTMQTTIVFLAALALTGCYTGLRDSGGEGRGDGAGDGPGGADAADGADDGADDDASDDPAQSVDEDPPFNVPSEEVKMLPFPVRMTNLSAVTGAALTHPIFFDLYKLRYQLGDHDYSTLQSPDDRWSPQKMQNWVKGLLPVCDSPVMQAKYPELVSDPAPLIRAAFGRDPVASDTEPLQDIRTSSYDDATKYRLSCLTILSSLEFVGS